MQHVAIDLGGSKSQVCRRAESGEILEERVVGTDRLGSYLQKLEPSIIVLETCAEAFSVAVEARSLGHHPRVVPATLVRSLGVGDRGIKTDVRDARNTSAASCRVDLPSVHIPSASSRERKSTCSMRETLTSARTMLINCVRGWMRSRRVRIRKGGIETFARRARERLLVHPDGLPDYVERQLVAIEALTEQIKAADKELAQIAKSDETCARLMTVPGVGPVTSVRYAAAIDDVTRFGNAHEVESYIGLTPGEDSSSSRKRRTAITKAGAPKLRWALVQAAWGAWRTRPNDPMVLWAAKIADRRGTKVAIVALARKLAGILFAMWRDGTPYNPGRGAVARASTE